MLNVKCQMAFLTREEILKIAALAHLKLDEAELEAMRGTLSSILDYVDRLSTAETGGVEPTAHIAGVENALREDEVRSCDAETREAVLSAFPAREGDQLRVRPVFE